MYDKIVANGSITGLPGIFHMLTNYRDNLHAVFFTGGGFGQTPSNTKVFPTVNPGYDFVDHDCAIMRPAQSSQWVSDVGITNFI